MIASKMDENEGSNRATLRLIEASMKYYYLGCTRIE